jgi:4-azaleucine resistance transporter AzlC
MTEHSGFTMAALRMGVRRGVPLALGLAPFGVVVGIVAQGRGLSLLDTTLMSALVYAGAGQLVVLGAWTHPASIFGGALACLVVNSRMALMGPVLGPWLDRVRGWRLWSSLFVLVDHSFAIAIPEMRAGRGDAAFLFGAGWLIWLVWVVTTIIGHMMGDLLRPPPGHPMFFAALAAILALLVPLWRGRRDVLPWLAAALAAMLVSHAAPGGYWHIAAGALAGGLTGALRDRALGRLP